MKEILSPPAQLVGRDLDQLCVNAIRVLSIDAIQKANSGHPGMPMGIADAAYVFWMHFFKHNPSDPTWPDRDRFVLSAGHGSMLIYSLLHLTGYELSLDEIKRFRQWGSRTAGHPEFGNTPGVETTTGPLGQGFANAVGMALAERYLATRFNRPGFPVVDHYTYALCSDGDLMEGISYEAASLAGHLKLDKLIVLYDSNRITIDGSTDLTFTEDTVQRFIAHGWQVQAIDGHDHKAVAYALAQAHAETTRPSLIICRTHIGYGSPNKQDSAKSHGEALGVEEVRLTRQALGWPEEPEFYVPPEVYAHMGPVVETGARQQREWEELLLRYREAHPDLAQLWDQMWTKRLPDNWETVLPKFGADAGDMATRVASGEAINALAPVIPGLIGGSADLTGSNNTLIKGAAPIQAGSFEGRNLFFGVREHAMGGILNGMALHGALIPYAGTFLIFSDYMRPAMRLAALMQQQVIYVFTHDSIGLGEDGPTHQPIEQLPTLRVVPNLYVVRPADAAETTIAWRIALERQDGPTALILTRQKVPTLNRNAYNGGHVPLAPASGALRGAYVLHSPAEPDVILIASGSEVHIALEAAHILEQQNIAARVVSMPCWELFEQQDKVYRDSVLPPMLTARVAIEAAAAFGWERYVGPQGSVISIDSFGASAPYKELYKQFGLTVEHVVAVATQIVSA